MDESNKDPKGEGENASVTDAFLANHKLVLETIERLQAREKHLTDVRDLEYKK